MRRRDVSLMLMIGLFVATALSLGSWIYRGKSVEASSASNRERGRLLTTSGLIIGRAEHAAITLPNGKILVVGGVDANGNELSSAELYDPETRSFSVVESHMSRGRINPTLAITYDNGRVLVTGGLNAKGRAARSVEVYDYITNTFTELDSKMNVGRVGHTATLLLDGRVLLAGGDIDGTAEIFDPSTGEFTLLDSKLSSARANHSATLLADGRVLIAGGRLNGSSLASAEIFDPQTGLFTPIAAMSSPRAGHTTIGLRDGSVALVGGDDAGTTDVFDGIAFSPRQVSMRKFSEVDALGSGSRTFIFGEDGGLRSIDLLTGVAEAYEVDSTLARRDHSTAALGNGAILVAGGKGVDGGILATAFVVGGDNASANITNIIITGSNTQNAGDANPLTVTTRNAGNTAETVTSDTQVSFSSNSATGGFSTSSSGPFTSTLIAIIPANQSSVNVFFRDTKTGTPVVTAVAQVVGAAPLSANQTQTINPAVANKLVITRQPSSTAVAGQPFAVQPIVEIRDQFDNLRNQDTLAITATRNAGSGTLQGTTTINAVNGVATFTNLSHNVATTITIDFTSGTLTKATSNNIVVEANVPAALVITSPAAPLIVTRNLTSGDITVTLRDAFGNNRNAASNTVVNLTSSSTGGQFISSADGTTVITSVTIAQGTSSATFRYRDSVVNTSASGQPGTTIVASSGTLTNGTLAVNVDNTRLVFIATATSVTAGQISGTFTLQQQDGAGNPVNVAIDSSLTITLTSSAGTGSFRDPLNNNITLTTVVIPAGQSTSGSFRYTDTVTGTKTITAAVNPNVGANGQFPSVTGATASITVTAGTPTNFIISAGAGQTITAGVASAAITVTLRDANNNTTSSSSAITLNLTSSSTSGRFDLSATGAFDGSITTITIAPGSSAGTFFYRATAAGSHTITIADSNTGTGTVGTQNTTFTINPAATAQLVFTTPAQSILAQQNSGTITVQRGDAFGNPNTADATITVNLTRSGTTGVFVSAADGNSGVTPATGTIINSVQIINGTSSANFLYRDTVAGTFTLTATSGSLTVSQTITVSINKVAIQGAGATVSAGTIIGPITVRLEDAATPPNAIFNVSGSAITVNLATNSPGGRFDTVVNGLFDGSVTSISIPNGASSATFFYKDTRSGTPTITASATGFASSTRQETINPATATMLVFTNAATSFTAGGVSGTLTIQRQDQFGNPNTADATITVRLSSSAVSGIFRDAADTANITTVAINTGSSSASFRYGDTVAGTKTLTGIAFDAGNANPVGLANAVQNITVNASTTIARLAITSTAQTINRGDLSGAFTVQSQDANGNPVNAGTGGLTVFLTSTSSTGQFISAADNTTVINSVTIAAGSNTAQFKYKDTTAGTFTIFAVSQNVTQAQQNITITSTNRAPAPTITASATTVNENGTFTLTAAANDPDPGDTATFTWTQTVGPAATLSATTGATITVTAPSIPTNTPVTLTFQVTATDAAGATGTATRNITVNNINQAPTVTSATAAPSTAVESSIVTLIATGTDPDSDTLTFQWTQTAGTAVTLSNNGVGATVTFTAPLLTTNQPVTLSFRVTASDGFGGSATGTVNVTITHVNRKPVAVTTNQTVNEGTTVTLSGSGSNDPDTGDTLTFKWVQLAGGPQVTLSSDTAANPTFTAPTLTSNVDVILRFQLTVSDGQLTSDPVVSTITVKNINQAPVANAGSAQTVNEGATVTLSGSGTDADGDTLTFAWTQTAGPTVTLSGANSATATFTAPTLTTNQSVTLTFRLTVSDGFGGSNSATVNVTVRNVNQAPVLSAIADRSVSVGQAVTITPSATDADSDTLTFSATGLPAGASINAQTGVITYTGVLADAGRTFNVTVTVSDGQGGTASQSFRIVVFQAGDVNADGRIDTGDLVALIQFLLGTISGAQAPGADVNGDGVVNVADLIRLIIRLNTP